MIFLSILFIHGLVSSTKCPSDYSEVPGSGCWSQNDDNECYLENEACFSLSCDYDRIVAFLRADVFGLSEAMQETIKSGSEKLIINKDSDCDPSSVYWNEQKNGVEINTMLGTCGMTISAATIMNENHIIFQHELTVPKETVEVRGRTRELMLSFGPTPSVIVECRYKATVTVETDIQFIEGPKETGFDTALKTNTVVDIDLLDKNSELFKEKKTEIENSFNSNLEANPAHLRSHLRQNNLEAKRVEVIRFEFRKSETSDGEVFVRLRFYYNVLPSELANGLNTDIKENMKTTIYDITKKLVEVVNMDATKNTFVDVATEMAISDVYETDNYLNKTVDAAGNTISQVAIWQDTFHMDLYRDREYQHALTDHIDLGEKAFFHVYWDKQFNKVQFYIDTCTVIQLTPDGKTSPKSKRAIIIKDGCYSETVGAQLNTHAQTQLVSQTTGFHYTTFTFERGPEKCDHRVVCSLVLCINTT